MLSFVSNGIYTLSFCSVASPSQDAGEIVSGLAIVRDGCLFGSDRGGCVIRGQLAASMQGNCTFEGSISVPAQSELITGTRSGESELTLAVHAVVYGDPDLLRFQADVAGYPVHVTARYVGPLPRDLPFAADGCGS